MVSTSEAIVTLVAPITLTYTLTNENPINTGLVDLSTSTSGSRPAYTAQTQTLSNSKALTTVTDAEGVRVAAVEWREMLSDKVTIRNRATMKMGRWMKSGFGPLHSSSALFQDDQGRKYQWKHIAAGRDIELHAEDTPGGPIAAFRRSCFNYLTKTTNPATLSMTARAKEIAETCVLSCLFLEKRRRMLDDETEKRGRVTGNSVVAGVVGMDSGMAAL